MWLRCVFRQNHTLSELPGKYILKDLFETSVYFCTYLLSRFSFWCVDKMLRRLEEQAELELMCAFVRLIGQ